MTTRQHATTSTPQLIGAKPCSKAYGFKYSSLRRLVHTGELLRRRRVMPWDDEVEELAIQVGNKLGWDVVADTYLQTVLAVFDHTRPMIDTLPTSPFEQWVRDVIPPNNDLRDATRIVPGNKIYEAFKVELRRLLTEH